jgi:hypothetical protein
MPDRRLFLMATLSTAAAPVIARTSNAQDEPVQSSMGNVRKPADVTLNVNGRDHQMSVDVRTSLLDLLQ